MTALLVSGAVAAVLAGLATKSSLATNGIEAFPSAPIAIDGVDHPYRAVDDFRLPLGVHRFRLRSAYGVTPKFSVTINNPSVVSAAVDGTHLVVRAISEGSCGLRIADEAAETVRFVGVRVSNEVGDSGLPPYLSIGTASETRRKISISGEILQLRGLVALSIYGIPI